MADSYNELLGLGSHTADQNSCWLKFNETSGTIWADSSGSSHPGNPVSGQSANSNPLLTGPTWRDNALELDWQTSRVAGLSVSNDVMSPGGVTSNGTLAIWGKLDTNATLSIQASCFTTSSANNGRCYMGVDTSGNAYYQFGNTGPNTGTPTQVTRDEWHLFVIQWNKDTLEYWGYLDGVQIVSDTTGAFGVSQNPRPGGGQWSDNFEGQVTEFTAFNRVLSLSEMNELYTGPEPLNLTAPVMSTDGTVTSGTWNLVNNGALKRDTALYNASGDTLITSSTDDNPDFSGDVSPEMSVYVIERGSNDGDHDTAEDSKSNTVVIEGGPTVAKLPPDLLAPLTMGI